MADLADAMINGKDIAAIDDIAKHKEWADMIMKKYDVTAENCHDILKEEIGDIMRILIVEDELKLAEIISDRLKKQSRQNRALSGFLRSVKLNLYYCAYRR